MELFNEVGGGRSQDGPSGMIFSATWPFCRLIMTDDKILYRLISKPVTAAYSELRNIRISRLGYIWFNRTGDHTSYAYTGRGLTRAVQILQDHEVPIPKTELDKLGFAVKFVKAQWIFAGAFLAVWLSGVIYALTMIITHYLLGQ